MAGRAEDQLVDYRRSLRAPAAVAIYAAFGTAWIVLSDVLNAVTSDTSPTAREFLVSTSKGLVFVAVTAVILYALLHRRDRWLDAMRDRALVGDQFREVFEESLEPMWVFDLDSLEILAANQAAADRYGWSREELTTMTLRDIWPPEGQAVGEAAIDATEHQPTPSGAVHVAAPIQHRVRDGRIIWVDVMGYPFPWEDRRARLVELRDVTDLVEARQRLTDERAELQAIIASTPEGIVTIDEHGTMESVNDRAATMFGYSAPDMVGRNVRMLMTAADRERHDGFLARYTHGGEPRVLDRARELVGERADGTPVPVELRVTELRRDDRPIFVGLLRDLTVAKQHEAVLAHQALHDPLTELPNRVLLLDRLRLALGRAKRHPRSVAVLFCDLDRFKVVNDGLGHAAGDTVLRVVAERFRAVARPADTVARFGGDELVVLCEDLQTPEDAVGIAERLLAAVRPPIELPTGPVHLTASIGVTILGAEPATAEDVIRDADAAMYRAKAAGRDRFEVCTDTTRTQARERLGLEQELHRAVDAGTIELRYQPVVEVATGRIVGVEALARWPHPTRGLLGPAEFLPVAEETGLIVVLGEQLLARACEQAEAWHRELGADAPEVAVNLSARQLATPGMVEALERALAATGLDPARLCLEITETVATVWTGPTARVLAALRDHGVGVAMDDVGAGSTSLARLRQLPLTALKIDRGIVSRLVGDPADAAIGHALVDLAHGLGLRTIAEGVQTEAELAAVRALGCDRAQGFLWSPAVTAQEATALLHDTPWRAG